MDENATTKPTIETVLERMNRLGDRLLGEIDKVRSELSDKIERVQSELSDKIERVQSELSDKIERVQSELSRKIEDLRVEVHGEIGALRAELKAFQKSVTEQFAELRDRTRRVERKLEILNDNILSVQADQRDLEVRVEKLEPQAS